MRAICSRLRSSQLVMLRDRRPTSITGQGDRRINSSATGPRRMLHACSL